MKKKKKPNNTCLYIIKAHICNADLSNIAHAMYRLVSKLLVSLAFVIRGSCITLKMHGLWE